MSTYRDVPLIHVWYVFSVTWYEYESVILVPGTCITFYQMVLVGVVILYQVINIIRPSSHEFQNWLHTISCLSSVDFLRCYGSITE